MSSVVQGKISRVSFEEHQLMIDMYLSGHSTYIIRKKIKRSTQCISKHLKRAGIILRDKSDQRTGQHKVNAKYFEYIDTPTKAYLLGMIYADGNVYKNRFRLALQERDRSFLEKVKEEIGYEGPLGTEYRNPPHQNLTILSISRKEFVNNLKTKGVIPDKTQKLTFPSFLSEDLFIYFVHGLFDGDGCINLSKKRMLTGNVELRCQVDIAGCYVLLESIQNLFNKYNIPSKLYHSPNKLSGRLKFRGLNSLKIMNLFYKNEQPLYLSRKYESYVMIVKEFVNTRKNRPISTQKVLDESISIISI